MVKVGFTGIVIFFELSNCADSIARKGEHYVFACFMSCLVDTYILKTPDLTLVHKIEIPQRCCLRPPLPKTIFYVEHLF